RSRPGSRRARPSRATRSRPPRPSARDASAARDGRRARRWRRRCRISCLVLARGTRPSQGGLRRGGEVHYSLRVRAKDVVVAAVTAAVVASLLYLNLDSGRVTPERASPFFSMPLGGLALIFGVRAWTESQSPDARWTGVCGGLA